MATSQTPGAIYQLKVALRGWRPPIWRRMLVPANSWLPDVHCYIQAYMGWQDYHLHEFRMGKKTYALRFSPEGHQYDTFDVTRDLDQELYRLNQLLTREKQKLHYVYDFGDSWEHEITLEKILSRKRGHKYPQLMEGKRRCPPEDCGGVWGYEEMLAALKNPDHPEHDSFKLWLGGEFNSEEFDLEAMQNRLDQMYSVER